jgi:hypothetical protein
MNDDAGNKAEAKKEGMEQHGEQAAPGAGEGAADPGKMTEEELRAELEKQFRQQQVADVLMQYMISLSSLAYVKMGITEDTRDVRDLEQARLAIDSFKGLLDSIGDRLDQQNQEALSGALASMQMTFAQASGGGAETAGSGPAGGEPDGEKKDDGPASRLWVPGKE